MMRLILASATALLAATAAPALALSSDAADRDGPAVPEDIVFDVYRNGSPFGEHIVRFDARPDGSLEVEVDIDLRVRFGPVTVFRYEHDATEVWRGGELQQMAASTLKSGERSQVVLERAGDSYRSDGGTIPDLIPSSHWRGYPESIGAILNTETGEPLDVTIQDLGPDRVATSNGVVDARRIRMTGSLAVDLWYDETGRWVGCEFEARGQSIRYVLRES